MRNSDTLNGNSDIIALAKKSLKVGSIRNESGTGQLLSGLGVAAVDATTAADTAVAALALLVCGHGNGDSDESEDDGFSEHFTVWPMCLKVERMRGVRSAI